MKKTLLPTSVLLFFLFSFQCINAQPFTLLKDIFLGAEGSYATLSQPVNLNGTLYFTATDGLHGAELWRTDGTTAGTHLVKDINPGQNNGLPENLVVMGNALYFKADDGVHGSILWKSDGTEAGTQLVKVAKSEFAAGLFYSTSMVAANGLLFFVNDDGVHGEELWKSDGTESGTVLLKDIVSGAGGSSPSWLTEVNGLLYFATEKKLWKTDGTEAGTQIVKDMVSEPLNGTPAQFTTVGGTLFFTTHIQENNPQFSRARLWKTDGTTAGTVVVKVVSSAEETYITEMINVNGMLYFVKMYGSFRGELPRRYELWKSNGSTAGTVRVIPAAGTLLYGIGMLAAMNGNVYFSLTDEWHENELWRSDGTAAGTSMVKNINPTGPAGVQWPLAIDGKLYFNASDGVHGAELWTSDGTAAGTSLVQDFAPGPESSVFYSGIMGRLSFFPVVTKLGNQLVCVRRVPAYGVELWVSSNLGNGCTTPTNRLYVNKAAIGGNGSSWACAINELCDAVSIANDNPAITEIWVAKGTYKPTASTNRNSVMLINRANLQIVGGFTGGETNAGEADPITNQTIISGDIGNAGSIADNSFHLLRVAEIPASANGLTINGFLFEKGNANDPNIFTDEEAFGGAIIFTGNHASTNILIKKCLFTANTASAAGGAVGAYNASQLVFDSCVFMGNAAGYGGAFACYGSTPVFKNTQFRQNIATTDNGGAVEIYYGSASFTNTVFDRNVARLGGGAVHQQEAAATYLQCVFSQNTASGGGAIFQQSAASQIASSTFFANSGDIYAGGIAVNGTGAAITSYNSIFWKNKINGVPVPGLEAPDVATRAGGILVAFANNLVQVNGLSEPDNGSTVSNNLRGINPLFASEAKPAGTDGWFGYLADGLELQNGSAAKNMGNTAYAAGLMLDAKGNTRIACTTIDIGAYENQLCPVPIVQNQPINITATNPFGNSLLIRYTGAAKAEVEISALSGQKLWKGSVIQKGYTQVNTASWPNGLYQITIRTAGQQPTVLKVVKAH